MDRQTAEPLSPPVSLRWAVATSAGTRRMNQDRHGALAAPETLLVVADGMGGHPGGAEAASRVVEVILGAAAAPRGAGSLHALVLEASDAIRALGRENPRLEGLGATVIVAVLRGRELAYAHAGDSRLYLFREGEGRLLTTPHELTSVLVRERVLEASEAESSPLHGRLTSYLGMEVPEVGVAKIPLLAGDRLLLVTDGALEHGEGRILHALQAPDIEDAAHRIASGAATEDNATAIVAEVFPRTAHV